MNVHTGLSLKVCGHLVHLKRYEDNRVAVVIVTPFNGEASKVQQEAINFAAKKLAAQAQRFLGYEWKIVPYKQHGRVLDLREKGSGY